jgi:hypothetical protein
LCISRLSDPGGDEEPWPEGDVVYDPDAQTVTVYEETLASHESQVLDRADPVDTPEAAAGQA